MPLLEIEQVCQLDDDGALHDLAAAGVAKIVIHEKEITQRAMDDVEAYVRTHLSGVLRCTEQTR